MPHPAYVEAMAAAVTQTGMLVDRAVLEHIASGTRLPSVGRIMDDLRRFTVAATVAAFDDITDAWTPLDLEQSVDLILVDMQAVVTRAFRDAQRRRVEVEAAPDVDLQDDDSVAGAIRRGVGLGVVLAAFQAAKGRLPGRRELGSLAARAGDPMPRQTAGMLRQIVRTQVAVERNRLAATVADREGLVIRVEDARKGPTDEPCEDVNGRYATTVWLRRHPVEHPNCTRRGRPVRLPPGQFVTLLD